MSIAPLDSSNSNYKARPSSVSEQTPLQRQKTELNIAILKSTRDVTIGVKDHPLELVFRTAIDSLNERLAPEPGENAIQNAASSGVDFSPEATADRIVSLSTGFYDSFKNQHENEKVTEVQRNFMATIRLGIEQGFDDAREILDMLKVLAGDVASDVDETYDWVQQGLVDFESGFKTEFDKE